MNRVLDLKIGVIYSEYITDIKKRIEQIIQANSSLQIFNLSVREINIEDLEAMSTFESRKYLVEQDFQLTIVTYMLYESEKIHRKLFVEKLESTGAYIQKSPNWNAFEKDIERILKDLRTQYQEELLQRIAPDEPVTLEVPVPEEPADEPVTLEVPVPEEPADEPVTLEVPFPEEPADEPVTLEVPVPEEPADEFKIGDITSDLLLQDLKAFEIFENETKSVVQTSINKPLFTPQEDVSTDETSEDMLDNDVFAELYHKLHGALPTDQVVAPPTEEYNFKVSPEDEGDTPAPITQNTNVIFEPPLTLDEKLALLNQKEEESITEPTDIPEEKVVPKKTSSFRFPKVKLPSIPVLEKKSSPIKTTPSSAPRFKEKKNTLTDIDLGFIGNLPGVGTTFISLAVAQRLSSSTKVCYVDMQGENISKLLDLQNKKIIRFDVYSGVNILDIYKKDYTVRIYDYGTMNLNTKKYFVDFERCTLKFIVGAISPLKIYGFNVNYEYDAKNIYSIINFQDMKYQKNLQKEYVGLNILTFPFVEDINDSIESNLFDLL